MMGLFICKYEPLWKEVSVESPLLRWPLGRVGLLLTIQYITTVALLIFPLQCLCIHQSLNHIPLKPVYVCLLLSQMKYVLALNTQKWGNHCVLCIKVIFLLRLRTITLQNLIRWNYYFITHWYNRVMLHRFIMQLTFTK